MSGDSPTVSGDADPTVANDAKLPHAATVDRSLLVEEAVQQFLAARRDHPDTTPSEIVAKYRRYGPALASSIERQLEVELFLKDNPWATFTPPTIHWPSPGESIGAFRVLEQLGSGALARVYLCEEPQLDGRQMVLKVGRASLQEARTLSRLQHPNIVPIYSVVNEEGRDGCVICMPFFGRSTLHDVIGILRDAPKPWRSNAFSVAGALWVKPADRIADARPPACDPAADFSDAILFVAEAIASALCYAHGKGVLHGDIKPSNILITPDGAPLLLDFNLSGDVGGENAPRGGTLPYMAPEQLRLLANSPPDGNAAYDARSDIYSLAACLFELTTGRPPVTPRNATAPVDQTASEMLAGFASHAGKWSTFLSSLDPGLANLIERCLQVDPDQRPLTAANFLQHILSLKSARYRFARSIRRHRQKLARIGGIATCLIALTGWGVLNRPLLSERLLVARKAGDVEQEVDLLLQACQEDPSSEGSRFSLGWALVRANRIEESQTIFLSLVKASRRGQAESAVAYCFQLLRRPSEAIAWYEKAILAGDRRVAVLNNAAVAYEHGVTKIGRSERLMIARDYLREAHDLDPTSDVVLLNLAKVEFRCFQRRVEPTTDKARVAAEKLIEIAPATPGHQSLFATIVLASPSFEISDIDRAVGALILAAQEGEGPSVDYLRSFPQWSLVMASPNYQRLLRALESAAPVDSSQSDGLSGLISLEPGPRPVLN